MSNPLSSSPSSEGRESVSPEIIVAYFQGQADECADYRRNQEWNQLRADAISDLLRELTHLRAEHEQLRAALSSQSDLLLRERAEHAASIAELRAEHERLKAWRSDVTVALMRPGGAHYEDVAKHAREMRRVLSDLYATVIGECPSLLDEDSGGSAGLAMRIEKILGNSETQEPSLTAAQAELTHLRAEHEQLKAEVGRLRDDLADCEDGGL